MIGHKKGQISFVNLIMILITCILYFMLLPLLNDISDMTVTDLEASPNEYTSLEVALIYLLPFLVLLMIVITGFNYAIPRVEGGRY